MEAASLHSIFMFRPYPVIEFFDAKPVIVSPGESSNLSWSVIGADKVRDRSRIGDVMLKGSKQVSPSETTTYTLIGSERYNK